MTVTTELLSICSERLSFNSSIAVGALGRKRSDGLYQIYFLAAAQQCTLSRKIYFQLSVVIYGTVIDICLDLN